MRRLLCAVAAIALIAPAAAAAQAQDNSQNQNRPHHGQNRPANQHQQNRPSGAGHQRPEHRPSGAGHQRPENVPPKHHQQAQPETHRSNRPMTEKHPATTHEVYRPGHRPSTYHRIRGPAFHYPHGYHYRHWTVGGILPGLFLSNYYYWTDWAALGLGPPPPGYVWVRYGPDLLLVNRHTGRIADVIRGAFY